MRPKDTFHTKKFVDRKQGKALKKAIGVVIKSVLFFIFFVVCIAFINPPESLSPVFWRFFAELIPLIIIIIGTLIFWLIDKRSFELHLTKRPLYGVCIGILSGIIWLGASTGILIILGVMRFEGSNHVGLIGIWFFSALINAATQEILVRGYLYQMVKSKYNLLVATIVTTALFTFLHGGAFEAGVIPVLNVITMSLFMTTLLEYTDSLVAPIVIHFFWNGVGAIILDGVSLPSDYPHLLNSIFEGNQILSGGIWKIEGSIVVFVLNLVLSSYFLIRTAAPNTNTRPLTSTE